MIDQQKNTPESSINIQLNGRQVSVRKGFSLDELLQKEAATGPGIAVEINQQVIRRASHAETVLEEGDLVEIVRLVGGG